MKDIEFIPTIAAPPSERPQIRLVCVWPPSITKLLIAQLVFTILVLAALALDKLT